MSIKAFVIALVVVVLLLRAEEFDRLAQSAMALLVGAGVGCFYVLVRDLTR